MAEQATVPSMLEVWERTNGVEQEWVKTLADASEKLAKADVGHAEADAIRTRTALINQIRRQIALQVQLDRRAQSQRALKLKTAEEHSKQVALLLGDHIPGTAGITSRWKGFDFFTTPAASVLLGELQVADEHRAAANFIPCLQNGKAIDMPADVTNFPGLKFWMRNQWFYFVPGSPVQALFARAVDVIYQSQQLALAALEKKIADGQAAANANLDEWLKFLSAALSK